MNGGRATPTNGTESLPTVGVQSMNHQLPVIEKYQVNQEPERSGGAGLSKCFSSSGETSINLSDPVQVKPSLASMGSTYMDRSVSDSQGLSQTGITELSDQVEGQSEVSPDHRSDVTPVQQADTTTPQPVVIDPDQTDVKSDRPRSEREKAKAFLARLQQKARASISGHPEKQANRQSLWTSPLKFVRQINHRPRPPIHPWTILLLISKCRTGRYVFSIREIGPRRC